MHTSCSLALASCSASGIDPIALEEGAAWKRGYGQLDEGGGKLLEEAICSLAVKTLLFPEGVKYGLSHSF